MPPKAFLFFSLAFILVSSPLILYANSSTSQQSLNYLANFQDLNTGGLKEEYVDEPQTLETDWGIMAFSAWGYDSSTVGSSKSLIDFALSDACALTALTDIERRVLALESAGIDSAQIGCDLAHKIISEIKPSGQIGDGIISSVFGALALSAADQTVSDAAISYIEQNQKSDGGWDSGWGTESNFTAQAIMALASSGKSITSEVIDNAKTYLKNLQTDTGGIKYDGNEWSTESDAFSDAYVLQAIYALGENPDDSYWLNNGKSIVNDLEGFKNHEDYLTRGLKKNRRRNLRKDRNRILKQKPEIIINNFADFDYLVKISKKRFEERGMKTDWEDPRRIKTFEEVIKLGGKSYQTRMITVKINEEIAGVDLICLHKKTYFTLKCGYNVKKFHGIGNFINLLEIDDAIKLGMKKIDFLQNNYGWKNQYFQSQPLFKFRK